MTDKWRGLLTVGLVRGARLYLGDRAATSWLSVGAFVCILGDEESKYAVKLIDHADGWFKLDMESDPDPREWEGATMCVWTKP